MVTPTRRVTRPARPTAAKPAASAKTAAAPRAFATAVAFRAWLERHHADRDALVLRLFRTHVRGRGIGYVVAVDEALCFGWIDGVRRALDADSFTIRFTPRRPRSIWSAVNIRKVEALIAAGRMREPGLAAFRARSEARSRVYSFEREQPAKLDPAHEREFRRHRAAWAFFERQAPWYRRTCLHWVTSAKREETRTKRLAILIDCCEAGRAIPALAGKPLRG
jgi:uncharacterized protein YdeI (YjbR/CyaY-like superfamily)